jgi:Cu-processing system ATP-binding protein
MEDIIQIKQLQKSFGKLEVLKKVDCNFSAGGVVGILGPNASGKTTLIKSILGMVIPDGGEIIFKGKSVSNSFEYKKDIGYMPQIGRYPDNMKIGDLFKMMKDLRNVHDNLDTDLIIAYGLDKMNDKVMHTLSGGTRQKVSAALAFLFNPPVLILDEPTAGLDPLSAEVLKDKINKEKAKGKLILITSHILTEMDEMADKVMYLLDGNIKFYKVLYDLKSETGEQKLGKALTKILSKDV